MVDMDELFSDKPSKKYQDPDFPQGRSNPDATVSLGHMSNNVVDVMQAIASNKGIRTLLYVSETDPFDSEYEADIPDEIEILAPNNEKNRISPVSFNMDAQIDDRTEIRVYYNIGRFSKEGKHVDYNIHIDIICAKTLWLMRDINCKSKIRPYEIMSRIFDVVGQKNINQINIGKPVQFQMLSVNERFDAIRIYFNTHDIVGDVDKVKGW